MFTEKTTRLSSVRVHLMRTMRVPRIQENREYYCLMGLLAEVVYFYIYDTRPHTVCQSSDDQ